MSQLTQFMGGGSSGSSEPEIVAPLLPHITLLALNLRFTRDERDAIRSAEITDPDVGDLMYLMTKARYIDLDNPVTIMGLQMLEAKTLLGPGRANIILSATVQPGEQS